MYDLNLQLRATFAFPPNARSRARPTLPDALRDAEREELLCEKRRYGSGDASRPGAEKKSLLEAALCPAARFFCLFPGF